MTATYPEFPTDELSSHGIAGFFPNNYNFITTISTFILTITDAISPIRK
jgi:hypothetical protein